MNIVYRFFVVDSVDSVDSIHLPTSELRGREAIGDGILTARHVKDVKAVKDVK